ncbi:hypothetical protein, partial [Heliobacterium mobile]|uniref:hypothetical protein n=1 Tax=Heliobacterium mobile TaxID=28064 RepID=UPI001A9B76BF
SPVVGLIGKLAPGFEEGFQQIRASVSSTVADINLNIESLQTTAEEASAAIDRASDNVSAAFQSWDTPGEKIEESANQTVDASKTLQDALRSIKTGWKDAGSGMSDTSEKAKQLKTHAEDVKSAWQVAIDTMNFKLSVLDAEEEKAIAQLGSHAQKIQEVAVKTDFLNQKMSVQAELIRDLQGEYAQLVQEKGEDDEATRKTYLDMVKAEAEMAKMKKEVSDLTDELIEQEKQFSQLSDKVVELAKKYKEDLTKAQEDYRAKVTEINHKLREDEQKATADFQKELQNRADGIADFVGLFSAVEHKRVSGADLLNNLGDQVNTLRTWESNLSGLRGRGISDGLLSELQKLGPKAADEVQALTEMTDEQLHQYVSLWQQRSSLAKSEAVNELQDLAAQTSQKIAQLRADAAQQLEQYRLEWQQKTAEIKENALKDLKGMVDDAEKMGALMVTRLAAVISKASPELASALQGFDPRVPQMNSDPTKVAQVQKNSVLLVASEQKAGVIQANRETAATVIQTWSDASTQMMNQQTQIKENTLTLWQTVQTALSSLWAKLLADVTTTWASMKKTVFDVINEVSLKFEGLVSKANYWGVSLMTTFIAGIRSQFGHLEDVLWNMTSLVDSYMPHSPAKVGPLSRLGETGPWLVKVFADGISNSLPYLATASAKMAGVASVALPGASTNPLFTSGNAAATGSQTFHITIHGSNGQEIWEQLERQLVRRGVRLSG